MIAYLASDYRHTYADSHVPYLCIIGPFCTMFTIICAVSHVMTYHCVANTF